MTRDQKTVGIGAASGVAAMIATVSVIYQRWPTNLGLADGSSRLVYALQASALAGRFDLSRRDNIAAI